MIELSVDNLHLTYGDNPVLKGVSMELKRGEVVSLLGPSGSGKTTLLRAVAGLEKPTAGRITIGNNVTIGAGSVVLDTVPDNALVVGEKARVKVIK